MRRAPNATFRLVNHMPWVHGWSYVTYECNLCYSQRHEQYPPSKKAPPATRRLHCAECERRAEQEISALA